MHLPSGSIYRKHFGGAQVSGGGFFQRELTALRACSEVRAFAGPVPALPPFDPISARYWLIGFFLLGFFFCDTRTL